MDRAQVKAKLEKYLAWLAKRIIRKYRPDVIAITGSIGKTSTKETVYAVLSGDFAVRKSEGNLNNELGLPLSIIGVPTAGRSFIGWIKIFSRALSLLTRTQPYPEILILEMGADHPGDLEKLTGIARPRVSITTAVAPVHTEFFDNLHALAEEKSTLVRRNETDGYVILNADDPVVVKFSSKAQAPVLTYGLSPQADVRASDIEIAYGPPRSGRAGPSIAGMNFRLHFDGRTVDVFLNEAVGLPAVTSALAGAAVGLAYGIDLKEVVKSFEHFHAPKGRLHLINGVHESILLDDTYNSSPRAALAALESIDRLADDLAEEQAIKFDGTARRPKIIAVFGDMAELGNLSEISHQQVGKAAAKTVDFLVTVGKQAEIIAKTALKSGLAAAKVASFQDRESAVHLLKQEIKANDLVLIKGSQSARMEKVTAALLADPSQAQDILVRQGEEWK